MVYHYELIVFYCLGGSPRTAIKRLKVSRTVAYAWFHRYKQGIHSLGYSTTKTTRKRLTQRMFRLLEKKAPELIFVPFFVPPSWKEKPNRLDHLTDG